MIRPRQRKVVIVAEEEAGSNEIWWITISRPTLPLHHTTSAIFKQTLYKQQMLQEIFSMEQRRPPEYIIEVFADPSSVKDVVRGFAIPNP